MKHYIKNSIKLLLFTVSATAFVACENEYIETNKDIQLKTFGVSDGIDDGSGSPNITPSFVTTYEIAGLMDISTGFDSHVWEFYQRTADDKGWEKMDDFDTQFIRENSGIPSTELEDFDPLLYTMKEPMPQSTDLASLLFFFDKPGHYKFVIRNTYSEPINYPWAILDPVINKKAVRYFDSFVQDGTNVCEKDFEFRVYMKLIGHCNIYKDANKTDSIKYNYRVVETKDYEYYEIKKGTTLYYDEVSGDNPDFDFDYVDSREWKIENYDGSTAPLPQLSSTVDKNISITFNDPGQFRVVLKQGYITPSGFIQTGKMPDYTGVSSPIPLIIKVVE